MALSNTKHDFIVKLIHLYFFENKKLRYMSGKLEEEEILYASYLQKDILLPGSNFCRDIFVKTNKGDRFIEIVNKNKIIKSHLKYDYYKNQNRKCLIFSCDDIISLYAKQDFQSEVTKRIESYLLSQLFFIPIILNLFYCLF